MAIDTSTYVVYKYGSLVERASNRQGLLSAQKGKQQPFSAPKWQELNHAAQKGREEPDLVDQEKVLSSPI